MNFKEIISKLDEKGISKNNFADENVEYFDGIGKCPIVAQKGGNEGDGQEYFIVRHFVDDNVYIKLSGCYDSYNGVDFSGEFLIEVEPKNVMITVYNPRVILSFNEINRKILSLNISPEEFAKFSSSSLLALEKEVGEIKIVEQVGGSEGDGDLWYIVKYFVKHDVYARVDAYYSSFDGTEFSESEIYEVKPIERKVIFYEP